MLVRSRQRNKSVTATFKGKMPRSYVEKPGSRRMEAHLRVARSMRWVCCGHTSRTGALRVPRRQVPPRVSCRGGRQETATLASFSLTTLAFSEVAAIIKLDGFRAFANCDIAEGIGWTQQLARKFKQAAEVRGQCESITAKKKQHTTSKRYLS